MVMFKHQVMHCDSVIITSEVRVPSLATGPNPHLPHFSYSKLGVGPGNKATHASEYLFTVEF